MRRTGLGVVLTLALAGAACSGSGAKGSAGGPSTTGGPPFTGAPTAGSYEAKTSNAVVEAVASVATARRGGDFTGLSTALVRVRSDGFIELVLHTAVPVTAAKVDETRRLGAEVVGTLVTPATASEPAGGLLQLWVPAESVPAVGALPWVAAVTPPAYPAAGG